MKKMKPLKLMQLNKEELKKQELNSLKGGSSCSCGCWFQTNPLGRAEVLLEFENIGSGGGSY